MWRFTAVAGLVAVMGIAALSTETTSVHACSGPAPDRVAESEVIVEGRITSYSLTLHPPDVYENPKTGELEEYRIRRATEHMNLEVTGVFKGLVPEDSITLLYNVWEPGAQLGGECGGVARDKEGQYTIVGVSRTEDGNYQARWTYWFYEGSGPSGDGYREAIERMARYPGAASLPRLGSGPTPSSATHHLVAAVAALGIALLAASFAIRFGTGRKA